MFAPLLFIGALLVVLLIFFLWRQRPHRPTHPFDQIKTQTAEVDGWNIRYHQSGSGPHLLLLHGLGANLFCWRWILPILNTRFTVTAIDLPGFGQSSKPLGAKYGLDEQAERLDKILEHLKIRQTYIVGNSMGGNIALWFALLHPTKVLGMALIAPATSARLMPVPLDRLAWISGAASLLLTRQTMKWAHGRTVSKTHLVDQDRVEETFRTYGRQNQAVRSFMLATAAIRDPRLITRLKDFTSPVLLLWGSRDRLVNRQVIDDLESALPKAESYVHVGGGHHLQEDEPEWVAEKLTGFFRV